MAKITLDGITKQFDGGAVAVDNVSFSVEDGEFAVLLGPSGCGKTTVLRMIAGLETVSQGSILFDDNVVNDLPPGKRDIGMVFQNYALYPHYSVFDNIAFPLKVRKEKKDVIKQRVNEIAEILELTQLLKRKPAELSGGQRQRVALGRAIVRNPKAFLFDEPLSNLDAKLRVQMRAEITNLQKRFGITSIYVTHDQTEAMTMGDKLILLKDGKIQQTGAPHELYSKPSNMFAAGFIGSPQMNFFKGRIVHGDEPRFESSTKDIEFALLKNSEIKQKIVWLGLRPEHLRLNKNNSASEASFVRVIEKVEYLGGESYVYFRVENEVKCAKIYGNVIAGAEVKFYYDVNDVYLFDEYGVTVY